MVETMDHNQVLGPSVYSEDGSTASLQKGRAIHSLHVAHLPTDQPNAIWSKPELEDAGR